MIAYFALPELVEGRPVVCEIEVSYKSRSHGLWDGFYVDRLGGYYDENFVRETPEKAVEARLERLRSEYRRVSAEYARLEDEKLTLEGRIYSWNQKAELRR